jgi:hypothetical protein
MNLIVGILGLKFADKKISFLCCSSTTLKLKYQRFESGYLED